jgi:DNA-binding NarL/FixJ family response regulator
VKSVLIVDDSQIIRNGLRNLFEREGWKVCADAADGQQAITQALQNRPQVVVLDLAMPVMNGLTAARILKKVVPEIHLILFSFSADLFKIEELRSAGFSAIVPKSQVRSLLEEAQGLVDVA